MLGRGSLSAAARPLPRLEPGVLLPSLLLSLREQPQLTQPMLNTSSTGSAVVALVVTGWVGISRNVVQGGPRAVA